VWVVGRESGVYWTKSEPILPIVNDSNYPKFEQAKREFLNLFRTCTESKHIKLTTTCDSFNNTQEFAISPSFISPHLIITLRLYQIY